MDITLTIPDAKKDLILDTICTRFNYTDNITQNVLDPSGNLTYDPSTGQPVTEVVPNISKGAFSKNNPFFEHARWKAWVAYREGVAVGRISAQIDEFYLERHDAHTGFFGLLEAPDDPAVFAALFGMAESWLAVCSLLGLLLVSIPLVASSGSRGSAARVALTCDCSSSCFSKSANSLEADSAPTDITDIKSRAISAT